MLAAPIRWMPERYVTVLWAHVSECAGFSKSSPQPCPLPHLSPCPILPYLFQEDVCVCVQGLHCGWVQGSKRVPRCQRRVARNFPESQLALQTTKDGEQANWKGGSTKQVDLGSGYFSGCCHPLPPPFCSPTWPVPHNRVETPVATLLFHLSPLPLGKGRKRNFVPPNNTCLRGFSVTSPQANTCSLSRFFLKRMQTVFTSFVKNVRPGTSLFIYLF